MMPATIVIRMCRRIPQPEPAGCMTRMCTSGRGFNVRTAIAMVLITIPSVASRENSTRREPPSRRFPVPAVTVEAGSAPQVTVEAAQITVQPAAPAVNNFAPNVIVDVPQPAAPIVNVEAPVVNIEPAVVNVAAPSVGVNVPEQVPQPRLPWRMTVRRDERTQLIMFAELVPMEA